MKETLLHVIWLYQDVGTHDKHAFLLQMPNHKKNTRKAHYLPSIT